MCSGYCKKKSTHYCGFLTHSWFVLFPFDCIWLLFVTVFNTKQNSPPPVLILFVELCKQCDVSKSEAVGINMNLQDKSIHLSSAFLITQHFHANIIVVRKRSIYLILLHPTKRMTLWYCPRNIQTLVIVIFP